MKQVLVVALNYRVTVFGNPSSPYLASKGGTLNIGLLDQRFAIEWLQQNIAAFGGDPERMIAFGQSAGSISADFLAFAYPDDPIITGVGGLSASALTPVILPEIAQGNFTDLAGAVGCGTIGSTDQQIFECMQTIPWQALVDYIVGHPEKGYLFHIVADNVTAFNDIPARIASGNVSNIPMFQGQVSNEGDSLVPFSFDGIDYTAADTFGNTVLICPASEEAKYVIVWLFT